MYRVVNFFTCSYPRNYGWLSHCHLNCFSWNSTEYFLSNLRKKMHSMHLHWFNFFAATKLWRIDPSNQIAIKLFQNFKIFILFKLTWCSNFIKMLFLAKFNVWFFSCSIGESLSKPNWYSLPNQTKMLFA